MKRRTRHALILLGVPILLALALGGWIVDAIRMPVTLHDHVVTRRTRATQRPEAASGNNIDSV